MDIGPIVSTAARYVLQTAVLTAPGTYSYEHLSVVDAKAWLARGEFVSAIAYDATVTAMGLMLGVRPPVSRQMIRMQAGDEALVFRLTMRASSRVKPHLTPDFVLQHCKVGLLRRLS